MRLDTEYGEIVVSVPGNPARGVVGDT